MKLLSIDPGIKHLAFCLFDITNEISKIIQWDIINICDEDTFLCQALERNNKCNKSAKYKNGLLCFCLKHAKKQPLPIPLPEDKMTFISKQKMQILYEIAKKYNIQYDVKIKKIELLKLINDYVLQHFLQPIILNKASEVNLYNIGLNIKTKFNNLFNNEICIDYVIIENQISPIATRMKTIQGMIVQYFIMSNVIVHNIEFVSASNKLKMSYNKTVEEEQQNTENKNNYNNRKKQSVSKCLEIITKMPSYNNFIAYFNQHKKKDDLSDAFLQGIWFIQNKINNKL